MIAIDVDVDSSVLSSVKFLVVRNAHTSILGTITFTRTKLRNDDDK